MVRTFLQVAAGAADILVTRLLGQSQAGTGRFVVIDDKTGQVIQLSGDNYKPNE